MNRGIVGRLRDTVTALACWILSTATVYWVDNGVLFALGPVLGAVGAVFFVLAVT